MGKNQKKKGKGAEKTAAKTDKKMSQKMKKQLKESGEASIEEILAQLEKEEKKKNEIVKKTIESPTRRVFASLTPHPYKDELLLFGGEFHNGHETSVYNDLFVYKIPTNEWTLLKIPGGPPPRTSHQVVPVPSNKGELWLFGGEFTTKSESQFYHYKDLWVLSIDTLRWTQVQAPGGPTSRSGHRMVLNKRQLIVFGGYHDNLQDCKYYNDVYSFNLDERKWTRLEPTGTPPCPRSGCIMAATPEGKIVIWGGYSKTKVKKDVEVGTAHSDMFLLSPDKNDTTGLKWKWSNVKPGGMKYGARSGVSGVYSAGKAYTFGGSTDHETEEDMTAEFFNELHCLDLTKLMWTQLLVSPKKETNKRRRKVKNDGEEEEMDVDEPEVNPEPAETVVDDGVFTMTIAKPLTSTETSESSKELLSPQPHPRINPSVAIKGSLLFVYGGLFEDDDREHTLSDFYSIDLRKLDEWKTLIECDLEGEWVVSSESDDAEEGDDDEEEEESGNEEEEDDDDMSED